MLFIDPILLVSTADNIYSYSQRVYFLQIKGQWRNTITKQSNSLSLQVCLKTNEGMRVLEEFTSSKN